MKKVKRQQRNKAWVGAAIGAAASLIGSLISSKEQENAEMKRREEEARSNTLGYFNNLNNMINGSQDAVEGYKDRFGLKCGGRKKVKYGCRKR